MTLAGYAHRGMVHIRVARPGPVQDDGNELQQVQDTEYLDHGYQVVAQGRGQSRMLERIRVALSALPPSEQRVGRLLLEDPVQFAVQSVVQLAMGSRTSTASVMRFCKSVGYQGLADLKRQLSGERSEGVPSIHRCVQADDRTADVFVKLIDDTVAALFKYRDHGHVGPVDAAVSALLEAHNRGGLIRFCGNGVSGLVAQDACQKVIRLGLRATANAEVDGQADRAAPLSPRDALVAISASGHGQKLVDAASAARRAGASSIVMTCTGSPLSKVAGIFVAADHPEGFGQYSPMLSRLLHLMIIDIIVTSTALRMLRGGVR